MHDETYRTTESGLLDMYDIYEIYPLSTRALFLHHGIRIPFWELRKAMRSGRGLARTTSNSNLDMAFYKMVTHVDTVSDATPPTCTLQHYRPLWLNFDLLSLMFGLMW